MTPWTTAHQTPLSFTTSWSLLKVMSIESVIPSNHLICFPLLLLPSVFRSIRVFSNESVLCIRWPKIGASASASVFPMDIQDWFPLAWTCVNSLLFKGLFESSPTPQFKSINSSALSLLYGPTWTFIRDYWKKQKQNKKNIVLTRWSFVGKVMSLLFNTV